MKTEEKEETELIGSRVGRLNPTVTSQSGASLDDDDHDTEEDAPSASANLLSDRELTNEHDDAVDRHDDNSV